jgi:hypothetical protein
VSQNLERLCEERRRVGESQSSMMMNN